MSGKRDQEGRSHGKQKAKNLTQGSRRDGRRRGHGIRSEHSGDREVGVYGRSGSTTPDNNQSSLYNRSKSGNLRRGKSSHFSEDVPVFTGKYS